MWVVASCGASCRRRCARNRRRVVWRCGLRGSFRIGSAYMEPLSLAMSNTMALVHNLLLYSSELSAQFRRHLCNDTRIVAEVSAASASPAVVDAE